MMQDQQRQIAEMLGWRNVRRDAVFTDVLIGSNPKNVTLTIPRYDQDETGRREILEYVAAQGTLNQTQFVTALDQRVNEGRYARSVRHGETPHLSDAWALLASSPADVAAAFLEVFEEAAATVTA